MIAPPLLSKGARIGITAPAKKISPEEMRAGIDVLKHWGFETVIGKNIYGQQDQFSGSDAQRMQDLQAMLDDDSIRAVIFARGGYGTLRIIDKLDFTRFRKDPKWIIGFSDITVLHSHIHNFGIETIHGPMLINFTESAETIEGIRRILCGEKLGYTIEKHPLNRNGNSKGEVAGGNLSLLYALKGSVSDIDCAGKVLFIEDLDEYLYHIDRMMLSLKRAGKLSNLAGLVVGGMTEMKDNNVPFGKDAEEIILDAVKEFSYPVCFGFPGGHIKKNSALPLGRRAELNVGEKVNLLF